MGDYVVVESRAAGSRGARAAAHAEKAAERHGRRNDKAKHDFFTKIGAFSGRPSQLTVT